MNWKSKLMEGMEAVNMLKAATQLQTDVGEETKEKNATKVATRSCRLDEDHKDKVRRIFYQLSTGVETGRYF